MASLCHHIAVTEPFFEFFQGTIIMSEARTCGCGRSPTGNCIGWHKLSKEEYEAKLAAYEEKQAKKAAAAE